MDSQLNYIRAQQRIAELSRAAADRRLAEQSRPHRQPARRRSIRRVTALLARISVAKA
jgi:hypothetical protein